MSYWPLTTIVSCAAPGAERGALDAAIELGIDYGGWIADGEPVPEIYAAHQRRNRASADNGMVRRLNVQDSDGTLVVTLRPELLQVAKFVDAATDAQNKPSLHICLPAAGNTRMPDSVADEIRSFIQQEGIEVLHVSGSTEGWEPGIQQATRDLLVWCFEDEIDLKQRSTGEATKP
jgi:hypothetical protein